MSSDLDHRQGNLHFLKKAWQDTFLPLVPKEERDNHHFGHYFLGWPSQKKGSKIAYLITGKFLTFLLFNLITLFTEFPLNLLAESVNFLNHKINSWNPENILTLGIRGGLLAASTTLYALFKGTSYLIRTITSPVTAYNKAKERHPAFGVASALLSTILIGGLLTALVLFAPPLFAALLPSMGPMAISVINALAFPVLEVVSAVGLALSTAAAAMLTLISGGILMAGFHFIGRDVIYPPLIAKASAKVDKLADNAAKNTPYSTNTRPYTLNRAWKPGLIPVQPPSERAFFDTYQKNQCIHMVNPGKISECSPN